MPYGSPHEGGYSRSFRVAIVAQRPILCAVALGRSLEDFNQAENRNQAVSVSKSAGRGTEWCEKQGEFGCGSLQPDVARCREIKPFAFGEVAEWSKAHAC
jgi:hypothetical protein